VLTTSVEVVRTPPSKGGSIESQSPTIYGGRTPLSAERIPYMLSKEFDLLIEPRWKVNGVLST